MALEIAKDGGLARPKILERILRLRKIALVLAYIGAYFCSQYLFDPANMEVTRISEHSLMPGLVTPKFDKSGIAIQLYRRLTALPKSKSQQEFVMDVFSELGLQCFTQKWRSTIAGYPKRGENVYGFVRGQRNDGAEAQLIVVQLGHSESARRMITRMLSFIDYAKDQVYWARDFVFVFVDGGHGPDSIEQAAFALDAFLFKYQKIESLTSKTRRNATVIADEIQTQTGALIAGVVYDLSGISVKGQHIINIQTNGLNGQQVNLDVFNGIVKIADSKHHSKVAIFGTLHRHTNSYMEYSPFTVPIKALMTQAFVSIEGIHSVMGKYGVQGLTVGLSHDYTERQSVQFVEEVSRMLNNVLERLHQSYFMYVLADDMHFLSIGFYLLPTFILICPLLISAYYEWLKVDSNSEIPLAVIGIHLGGYSIYLMTQWIFTNIGEVFAFSTEFPFVGPDGCNGQFGGSMDIVIIYLAVTMLPLGLYMFSIHPLRPTSIPIMRIFILLEVSITILCLSLINFGLGVFTAAIVVPITFLMTFESPEKTRSLYRSLVLALLHPITIITVLAWQTPGYSTAFIPKKEFDTWTGVPIMFIRNMIKNDTAFGSWHFYLITVIGWPVWNMIFSCSLPYNLVVDRVAAKDREEREAREAGGSGEEATTPEDPHPPASVPTAKPTTSNVSKRNKRKNH
ncbi:unnamed protein product [Caenorhabditis nigoni]